MRKNSKSKTNIRSPLTEEELETLKAIADYLCMDHLGDMCSFPRFEECFGAFFIDSEINLPEVFKDICGKKHKYITFRRLINAYIKWKTNSEKSSTDFQNFMNLLNKVIFIKNDKGVGNTTKYTTYFNTFNSKNKKAISKIAVITNEEKDIIKGFQVVYDEFFKNDLFQNDEKEKYYVSLELNLIADIPKNDKSTSFLKFPTRNDRDGITHIGGTFDKNKINFLVFKCRSGKTSFIGKPNGTPFLYGAFKKQLHVIKIGLTGGKLTYIKPIFDKVQRFNPNFNKSLNEINEKFLKNDFPIFEEKILMNCDDDEIDDKTILQPLVNDDRFFNEKKYKDKISGTKFIDICPNCQINKNNKSCISKNKFTFELKNILEEAGNFHNKHQEKIKQLAKKLNNPVFKRLSTKNNDTKMSVAEVLKDSSKFDNLLNKVESILINNLKQNAKKRAGSVVERINISNSNTSTEPSKEIEIKHTKTRKKSVSPLKEIFDHYENLKKLNNKENEDNNYNNDLSNFTGDVTSFFNPYGYSGSSKYYINDENIEKEKKNNEKSQNSIIIKHEEVKNKKLSPEQIQQKIQNAQKIWKNFSERYSKNQGIFIIQIIGAVIKALHLLREDKSKLSKYTTKEKLKLLDILKTNRNVVIMLSKAHKESIRRKMEAEFLKKEQKEFEEMNDEENEWEEEEKNDINEQEKNHEEETKILNEKYVIILEQMKRNKELSELLTKIKQEKDEQKKSVLQKQEELKRLEDKQKKIEESKKQIELTEQQKKIEENKQNENEKSIMKENSKYSKYNSKIEKLKKLQEENNQKKKDEEEFLSKLQIKKVLNPQNLPEIEAKIEFIQNSIDNNNFSEETKKKLKDYKIELIKDLDTIKEALNKQKQKKLAKELNFNLNDDKKNEEEREKLKQEEDERVEEETQKIEKLKSGISRKISIKNIEIPEGTQTWRKQKIPNKGKIFIDDLFQPIKNNLCSVNEIGNWVLPTDITNEDIEGWEDIKWSRVENIFATKNFQVFLDNIEESDIIQGTLGDCYFLSAAAALCKYTDQIKKIFFIKEKSEEHCYGCYFKINGIWKLILIDDYMPCYGNFGKNFAFTSTNGNELWVILLEKAWAKINGNYARIIGGEPHEIFDIFTNAYSERIKVKEGIENDIWKKLSRGEKEGFLITAGTSGNTYYLNTEEMGLVPGHAYTVLGIKELYEGEMLIHLRNPWGNGEWCGDWGDSSYKWNESNKRECGILEKKDDGAFWMSLSDFCKYFIVIGMCHLYKSYLYYVLHVPKKVSSVGAFLTKVEVNQNNTHCYIMLHQKNPRIRLKDDTYQKCVICYIMLLDSNYNYISANSDNNYQNLGIEVNLNKGIYYLISDINYRYVQTEQHGYNISSFASSPVYITPENNKNIEVVFKYGMYSYCKNVLKNGKSYNGGELFQSNKNSQEIPFSFTLFDNKNGQNDVTLTDILVCRGKKTVDYYFEGVNNKQNQIAKTICPGQWDIFCRMPYSRGALYSIQLKTTYQPHRGAKANEGIAKLSGEVQTKLDIDFSSLVHQSGINNNNNNNNNNTLTNFNYNNNSNNNKNSNYNNNNNNYNNSNYNNNSNNNNNYNKNSNNNKYDYDNDNNYNNYNNNDSNNKNNNNYNNNSNSNKYDYDNDNNYNNNGNKNNYNYNNNYNNNNYNYNNNYNNYNYNNNGNYNNNSNNNNYNYNNNYNNYNYNNNNNYNYNNNSNYNNNQNIPKKKEEKKDTKRDIEKKETRKEEKKENNHFDDVFREEAEPLDEYGLINQYMYQDTNGIHYIGFENKSSNELNMYLSLQGLYEQNHPYKNIVEFISRPRSKNVFVLKMIEGYDGNYSYMFGQQEY